MNADTPKDAGALFDDFHESRVRSMRPQQRILTSDHFKSLRPKSFQLGSSFVVQLKKASLIVAMQYDYIHGISP